MRDRLTNFLVLQDPMLRNYQDPQLINLSTEILEQEGVCFDPDNVTLQGSYTDELSAHRARRLWAETLEEYFLLENNHDIVFSVLPDLEKHVFTLTCTFSTACARYAFWRLTNNQAPEVQYVIETAHIPLCDSRHEDILKAPDLRPLHEEAMIWSGGPRNRPDRQKKPNWLFSLIRRLCK